MTDMNTFKYSMDIGWNMLRYVNSLDIRECECRVLKVFTHKVLFVRDVSLCVS